MRGIAYFVCFFGAIASLLGQELGGIAGVIADADGGVVAHAAVRVKNSATGEQSNTVTSSTGAYSVTQLRAGTYELTIPRIGFTFDPYHQKNIAVAAGQTLRLDIRLPFGGNLGTPGDDDSTIVRSRSKTLSGPTPRTADGKPDLSGVWNGSNDPDPEEPEALPWAEAISKERIANHFKDNPSVFCLPDPVVLTGPFFFKFVQTPGLLVAMVENPPYVSQIFLDGRRHPKDFNPSWMGHSTGKWEGDTLVVDTVGFNDQSWIDSYPHTEMMRVVTRYQRPDLGHLEVDIMIDDPGAFTKPWKIRNTWDLAPAEEIGEYICNENNKDTTHLVGK